MRTKLGYLRYIIFVWNNFLQYFCFFYCSWQLTRKQTISLMKLFSTDNHHNQTGGTCILTSSPVCQDSSIFAPISTFQADSKIWKPKLPEVVIRTIVIMTLNFVMMPRTLDFLWCLIEVLTYSLVHYKKKYRVKNVRIRCFSGPYFPAYGLNTAYTSL